MNKQAVRKTSVPLRNSPIKIGNARSPRGPGPSKKISIGGAKKEVLPEISTDISHFCGDTQNVPAMTRSEVRIFLSSTFIDYKVERTALATHAYPELKSFCANLGLDFQVVDMRWGVTDEAVNEHVVEEICLREIANCQRLSYGPNFVCLLGDRYGYRPFPRVIEASEFTRLKEVATSSFPDDVQLLDDWYKKDNNAVPVAFILQPVNTRFPRFGDFSPGCEEERAEARRQWYQVESRLQVVIKGAATVAHDRGLLSIDRLEVYLRSVTESEVCNGVLTATFPRNSALCYCRWFTEIRNSCDLSNPTTRRYIDLKVDGPSPVVNEIAQERLTKLKKDKIPQKLPDSNTTNFSVKWTPEGVDPNDSEHEAYISEFCKKFVQDLKKLITSHRNHCLENQKKDGKMLILLREEVHHHLRFCIAKCEVFCGREEEIEQVKSYITNNASRPPFVVHAASGCGKTALTAILAKKCRKWLGKNSVVILRFLGTSSSSSNLFKLIRSICQQVCHVYKINYQPDKCNNFSKAVKNLHHLISFVSQRFSKDRPLVIILDSLDQLNMGDTKSPPVSWLPKICPPGLRIILSTLPDDKNKWLFSLKSYINDNQSFLMLKPIDLPTSSLIIDSYLAHKSRAVNKKQYHLILDAVGQYPRPLFLRLLLDQACEWNSYQGMADEKFPEDVREAIVNLFKRLENRYGRLLVSYCLGYLTVGLNGLSEVELEDVLSCNNTVLNDVYQYHSPPSQTLVRIPSLLWARIKHDIEDYIVERQTDGKTTEYWYHRQFIEAAHEYFVKPRENELHRDLAKLYLATDSVKETVELKHRKLLLENCDRGVSKQTLTSSNKRLLNCLTYHLLRSGDTDKLLEKTYCNFKFLHAYIEAFSVPDLIQSLTDAYALSHVSTLETVKDFLRFSEGVVGDKVKLAAQIVGQLGSSKDDHLQKLCEQCIHVMEASSGPVMIPVGGCFPSSQSELKAYISDVKSVLCVSSDFGLVATTSVDRVGKVPVVKIVNVDSLSIVCVCDKFDKYFGNIRDGSFTEDKSWLVILCDKKVIVHSATTGERLFQSGLNINNAGLFNNACTVSIDKKYLLICGKERLCIGEDRSKVPGHPEYNLGDHKTFRLSEHITSTVRLFFVQDSSIVYSLHDSVQDGEDTSFYYVWDCDSKDQEWCNFLPSRCQRDNMVMLKKRLYFGCDRGQICYLEWLDRHKSARVDDINLKGLELSPILSLCLNEPKELFGALRQDKLVVIFNKYDIVSTLSVKPSPNKLLQMTDDGICMTASSSGCLQIWRYAEEQKLYERQVHEQSVDYLLSLDDNFVLTQCCKEETLNLWNFDSSIKIDLSAESRASSSVSELELQSENVLSMALSQDGRWLVTAVESGPPIIWTLVYDPISFMLVGRCEGDQVCDIVCFGQQEEYILARCTDTKFLTCWLTNSNDQFGVVNSLFKNEIECGVICANPSQLGIGACYACPGKGSVQVTHSLTLIPGFVNVFTLKHGQLLSCINLMSLSAKSIHDLRFSSTGEYLFVSYNAVTSGDNTSTLVHALHLRPNVSEFELMSLINDYSGNLDDLHRAKDLSHCFILCKRTQINQDTKSVKDGRCYAFCEYQDSSMLLACYGICPVWNYHSDELLLMEKMGNNRQWMKHSTAWYFHERRSDMTAGNVDAGMGQTAVTAVEVSEDGGLVITGADDGGILVWKRWKALKGEEGTKLYLKGHTAAITAFLIRSSCKVLVSASRDKTLRLWDLCKEGPGSRSLALLHLHAVPEKLWFACARPRVRVEFNKNVEASQNRESHVVALCSDIVRRYTIAVKLCHVTTHDNGDGH